MRWVIEWLTLLLIWSVASIVVGSFFPSYDLYGDLVFGWVIITVFCLAISGVALAMRLLERLTSPDLEDCTPPGGVGDKDLDVILTSGAVSTPEVACRTSGQNSNGGAS